ncbi:MAG: hypothetical protein H0X36_13225 [Sphingomonadaceae bacterium]|nr:hypothetical protein [Sphingomonadaceae bacterium]
MKAFRLRFLALGLAASLSGTAAHAQVTSCYGRAITVLDFRNPVLVSGTALSVGAIYRFANVAPGVDARVRINAISAGASLAIIDRDTGLIGNFQPELAGADARSADFTITFVVAGTATPIALDVAASGIDIDGDSASLREYAEFSTPFAAYVVDSPTNLDINASGPSVPANVRFESRTNFTAPGIDPTATANIVSILYTSTSSFQYRIGTLGTGNTVRLTSLDFSCPALALPAESTVVPQDFGDAPAAYGNPAHDIVAGIQIGATNTSEPARYNSPTATGDTGDDGVTITQLRRSQAGTATVTVSGSGGRLQAWIDWNGDGDFADAGEQIATDVADNGAGDTNPATGTIGVSIPTPAAATLTQTFARFRWSTTSGLGSSSTASNGEVEDYAITIFGPAVLSTTKTSAVYDPANANLFAVPGNDVLYTITTSNIGTGPADANSVFVVDALPATVEFFNGDVDGAGPATGAVAFTQTGAGLTFTLATDLRYSNLAGAPASFAACAYTPIAGYDPAVRYVCLNPKGTMLSGGAPAPKFSVQFRTRIK